MSSDASARDLASAFFAADRASGEATHSSTVAGRREGFGFDGTAAAGGAEPSRAPLNEPRVGLQRPTHFVADIRVG